ncbi:MAG: 4Fe-4S dicluster domain-containing protein [Bryobacteraceae bacterium]|nr:4Fe-4S dicluster domain-containing protein [Bryobacteraceae bacterium]
MPGVSLTESAVFLTLLCISSFLFWRRLSPVVSTIRLSKPDPGFRWGSTGKRIQAFVWEVLCQGKVIQQRPLPGIAHALVFWGFLAFGLVTIDHIAAGLRLDLLAPEGFFGQFYFAFAGLFAIAVAVSIIGLAVRRFLVRPIWLGKISYESGLIALLILTLMLTYLASWLWLPETSGGGRVDWWVHTIALLVFLPLVPHTKHLHLILSPVTIFLKRDGFSQIPPLNGDEDFGIQTGKDITNLVALQAFSCVECGRCTEHCPANNTGKVLDPKKLIVGLRRYLRDHGPGADAVIVGKGGSELLSVEDRPDANNSVAPYIPEEMLWQCTSCGACEYQCPVGIQHLPIIIGLRRGLVNTGQWEDEYGEKLFLSIEKYGNSLGFSSSERDKFITKSALPTFDGHQEYCLWLGCMGAYDPGGREIILSLTQVLDYLGVTWGVLKKEKCTGDPVRRLGNDLLVGTLAEFNATQLGAHPEVKVLTICPHCVRTMTEDWKEFGVTVQVEHHSTFLARHAAALPTAGRDSGQTGSVTFHDPCYLGRYEDTYQAPREVISRTATVLDPPRAEERGFCCGAGGGRMFLGEEPGERVNVVRARQLASTGAATIAAACPFCSSMFRDALAQISPAPPKLLDIAQIAAASLPRKLEVL